MNKYRRYLISTVGLFGLGSLGSRVQAHHTETHFEDQSAHKLVYQCNRSDRDYYESVLFSCGEMLRKYGDDIELVIAVMGPGMHILAKKPQQMIDHVHQERVRSLASYGVSIHACGNTMKSLGWTADDIFEESVIVPIGVDDLMQLQERGFSYVSW